LPFVIVSGIARPEDIRVIFDAAADAHRTGISDSADTLVIQSGQSINGVNIQLSTS
jgi:hypothetical protein